MDKKGPDLYYAGSKFKEGFLKKWLENPSKIRPLEFNSITEKSTLKHPALKESESEAVADFLMTLTSPVVKPLGIKPRKGVKGRIIFEKKQACYGCHTIRERNDLVGGLSGPTLAGAGERLNPDWVYAFLKDPYAFGTPLRMPVYIGILSDDEMRTLAAYLATFE